MVSWPIMIKKFLYQDVPKSPHKDIKSPIFDCLGDIRVKNDKYRSKTRNFGPVLTSILHSRLWFISRIPRLTWNWFYRVDVLCSSQELLLKKQIFVSRGQEWQKTGKYKIFRVKKDFEKNLIISRMYQGIPTFPGIMRITLTLRKINFQLVLSFRIWWRARKMRIFIKKIKISMILILFHPFVVQTVVDWASYIVVLTFRYILVQKLFDH